MMCSLWEIIGIENGEQIPHNVAYNNGTGLAVQTVGTRAVRIETPPLFGNNAILF